MCGVAGCKVWRGVARALMSLVVGNPGGLFRFGGRFRRCLWEVDNGGVVVGEGLEVGLIEITDLCGLFVIEVFLDDVVDGDVELWVNSL